MRVLMVTNMFPSETNPVFGVFVARQLDAIRERGVAVELVANRDARGGISALRKYASLLLRAVGASLRHRPDVVVGHFLYPTAWIARIAARLVHAPYVVVAHGTDVVSAGGPGFLARRTRDAFVRADGVVAVSHALAGRLHDELGLSADTPVHVIHMGVDLALFRPDAVARESLGWSPKDRVVVFVGNLVPVKGPDVLLDAFRSLHAGGGVDRLVYVGDGSMAETLRARTREFGLDDVVTFAGRLDGSGVAARLAAADVVAMPSRNEGLGLVAIEAMACGTPVVVSRVGGVPEVFPGRACGAFVEPDDPRALATALSEVLGNGKERYSAACVSAAALHDVKLKAEEFVAVLEEVGHRVRP